jgi:HK97 family phage major capsid protein
MIITNKENKLSESLIKTQQELRANLVGQIQETLDAAEERGGLDAEAKGKIDSLEAEIRSADEIIAAAQRQEERKNEAAEASRGYVPSMEERSDSDILRAIANGEVRSHNFEQRTLVSSTNTVPKSFFDQVFQVARLVGPMLDAPEIINTTSGEDITIPTLTAYSTASLRTEGSAIAESDPTFSSITLGAYKYAFLVPISNELLADAGFDIAGVIAEAAGNAIGFTVNDVLTTGDGSSKPKGIVTAAGSGITGGTAVSGAFTADNLIDLAYSLNGAARRLPGVAYMANTSSLGAMRKLKDNSGQYLYQVGVGQPDTFAGFPVLENPAMASTGTSAKSVIFGHIPSFKVRMAGGLQVATSTDYAFNEDLTYYRFLMRVDGDLTHAGHVKYFVGAGS